ncbi:MAG: HNH endonuclease signature motif containing protein [Candidatus Sulfotelmatobacter sp.]
MMSISSKDIKKLWGLAAGRCSRPGCDDECIRFLAADPTVIGEMAHVIAQSPKGPTGVQQGGEDVYENLILLCPTHHSEVDKAPSGTFPPDVLYAWKKQHEAEVASAFLSPRFPSKKELGGYVKRLLVENETAWRTYGPESSAAESNPISSLSDLWPLRKLGVIVPNNRRIVNAIRQNLALIDPQPYAACCSFIEHAEGFERNCYGRTENVPRFPKAFGEVIDALIV